ncbi:hypothetical protein A2U01_0072668, partial [Trifolium medium]|nr:hypothetical protein [Trifolium medium]
LDSGLGSLLAPDNCVGRRSTIIEKEIPSRLVLEAKKLIGSEEEVGIYFHEFEDVNLARTMATEGRDRAEKDGWEMSRDRSGFQ